MNIKLDSTIEYERNKNYFIKTRFVFFLGIGIIFFALFVAYALWSWGWFWDLTGIDYRMYPILMPILLVVAIGGVIVSFVGIGNRSKITDFDFQIERKMRGADDRLIDHFNVSARAMRGFKIYTLEGYDFDGEEPLFAKKLGEGDYIGSMFSYAKLLITQTKAYIYKHRFSFTEEIETEEYILVELEEVSEASLDDKIYTHSYQTKRGVREFEITYRVLSIKKGEETAFAIPALDNMDTSNIMKTLNHGKKGLL